jgi:hypothetical protein
MMNLMCVNIVGESHEGRESRLKNLNNYTKCVIDGFVTVAVIRAL